MTRITNNIQKKDLRTSKPNKENDSKHKIRLITAHSKKIWKLPNYPYFIKTKPATF